ncbi:MAG: tyrosine-type recombinase/integrase [Eubacterium sp.]|nr:tyrosine-type recombinase/integrase [Eubacterium sp.]
MNLENLLKNSDVLIHHMEADGYSKGYVLLLKIEINWLKENGDSVNSYEEACKVRQSQTKSPHLQRRYRLEYGILKRFDLEGIFPDYRRKEPLIKRGAYHYLNKTFKEMADTYYDIELKRGLKLRTVKGNVSAISCFLLSMQKKGCSSFADISEDMAMSFFTDSSGNIALSNGYRKQISLVFKSDLGQFNEDAKRILSYLPKTRPHRKNIQYLQPEEVESLHEALSPEATSSLTLRNRAIGVLLFFTALRACDIASLNMDDIDWENDEIRIIQDKTGVPLVLPMSAMVGNALYDYIVSERPESSEEHVFLGENRPHDPITAGAVFLIASKIYDAASIRLGKGERRGSHLFRYNAATVFVSKGIPRPVASATLGHEDPASLDYYTFADITHLRECSLSIERFPVRKGVFDI